jgi:triosephosphate isomerase
MQKYVIGNLKMHLETCRLRDEYMERTAELTQALNKSQKASLVICPPHVHLEKFTSTFPDLMIGAQDAHHELRGAFTGSTSSNILTSIGVKYVIIGHSERRGAGESIDVVCKKVQTALISGLHAVVCVGSVADGEDESEVIRREVASVLDAVR